MQASIPAIAVIFVPVDVDVIAPLALYDFTQFFNALVKVPDVEKDFFDFDMLVVIVQVFH
jgi:hypothetical protein